MDSIQIYQTHLKLLDGIIVSEVENYNGFLVVKSYLNDNWYDAITITDPLKFDLKELIRLEKDLIKDNINYALYFPSDFLTQIQGLVTEGYRRVGGDAYLLLNDLQYSTLLPNIEIVEVSEDSFETYKELIEQIHGREMGWPASSKFADIMFKKQQIVSKKSVHLNLAFFDGKAVGYSTSITSKEMGLIYLTSSGVLGDYRGKGIYTTMVNYAINKAIKQGIKSAYVITGQESKSWHASKKLGYIEVGRFEYYLRNQS